MAGFEGALTGSEATGAAGRVRKTRASASSFFIGTLSLPGVDR